MNFNSINYLYPTKAQIITKPQSSACSKNFQSSSCFDVFEKHISFSAKSKTKSYEEKLLQTENKLRNFEDHEEFYIVDNEGNQVHHRAVEGNEIYLTDEEENLARGKTIVHNHPNGTSISFNDYCVAFCAKVKEIRVITKDKIYSLKLPDGLTQEQADKIATSYANKQWIVCLNKDQTKQEASHKIWEWVVKDSKDVQLDYSCTSFENK